MTNISLPYIIGEKKGKKKTWQIIKYKEDDVEKYDVVYFYNADFEKITKEFISSKKLIKTFNNKKGAKDFLEKI